MLSQVVGYAAIVLLLVVAVAEVIANRKPEDSARGKRIGAAGWVIIVCSVLIAVSAAWGLHQTNTEKQAALEEKRLETHARQRAQEENQAELAEQKQNTAKLARILLLAEQQAFNGNPRAAIDQLEQANKIAQIDVVNRRIAELSRRVVQIESTPTPRPADTPAAMDRAPTLVPARNEPEHCQRFDAFSLCLKSIPIGPDRIHYIATASLVVREVDASRAPLSVFFPMAGVAELNAEGISGWAVESIDGARRCNNSHPPNCLKLVDQFSRIREGSVISIRLRKGQREVNAASLAKTATANVSGQMLLRIGQEPSIESFGFDSVPVKVRVPDAQ